MMISNIVKTAKYRLPRKLKKRIKKLYDSIEVNVEPVDHINCVITIDKEEIEEVIKSHIRQHIIEMETELKADPEFWKEVARRSMENAPKITFEPQPPGVK